MSSHITLPSHLCQPHSLPPSITTHSTQAALTTVPHRLCCKFTLLVRCYHYLSIQTLCFPTPYKIYTKNYFCVLCLENLQKRNKDKMEVETIIRVETKRKDMEYLAKKQRRWDTPGERWRRWPQIYNSGIPWLMA